MVCQEGQSNCSEQLRREKEPGRVLDSLESLAPLAPEDWVWSSSLRTGKAVLNQEHGRAAESAPSKHLTPRQSSKRRAQLHRGLCTGTVGALLSPASLLPSPAGSHLPQRVQWGRGDGEARLFHGGGGLW